MSKEAVGAIKRLPKKLWHLGKMMIKLARVSHEYLRTEHRYKLKIANLQLERDERLDEIRVRRDEIITSVVSFANEQEEVILKSGNKSVTTAAGQIGWRAIAPSVEIEEGHTDKTVIAWLQKRKQRYLRFTPALNKELILQDFRDGLLGKIRGLKIKQGTEFFISLAPRGKQKPQTITFEVKSD